MTNRQTSPTRRRVLARAALLALAPLGLSACGRAANDTASSAPATQAAPNANAAAALALAQVWKTPTCGCCKAWVEHLQSAGFTVKANDVPSTDAMRAQLGMPAALGSCHTALIGGFAIEGHVPAREIKRLLAEPREAVADVVGLSVPGMPIGSPGMEMGDKRDKYDVLLVLKSGQSRVYQSYV
jgi:hypothetical protein